MSDAFNDLIAGILDSTVNGGSTGGPMIPPSPYLTDEEPAEGDEQWIPHDELTEPEQDGWHR